jgi:hypothetical protein
MISSRAAGFRFNDDEYAMMDQLRDRFWLLLANRKQVLSMALRAVWDAVFTGGTLLSQLDQLQRVLCAHRESAQLCFSFPPPASPRFQLPRLVPQFAQSARRIVSAADRTGAALLFAMAARSLS